MCSNNKQQVLKQLNPTINREGICALSVENNTGTILTGVK